MCILVIGNIVYFVAAYYTYRLFEGKAIEKLGAKPAVHSKIIFYYFS